MDFAGVLRGALGDQRSYLRFCECEYPAVAEALAKSIQGAARSPDFANSR